MVMCTMSFLVANILLQVTLVASQPLEMDLVQIIKHLQEEGIEFKRKLGILGDKIHLQKEHIWKQDRRIKVLENIVKSQRDEILSQYPTGQYTGQYNSDNIINNFAEKYRIDGKDKGISSKQNTSNMHIGAASKQSYVKHGNVESGEKVLTDLDVAKSSKPGSKITRNAHLPSRSMMSTSSPVAFQAYLTNDLSHIAKHQTIVFEGLVTNIGGGYHSRHGLFTAPKSGLYIFSSSLLAQPNYYIEANIMKNGQAVKGILANAKGQDGFDQASGTAVIQLSIGDEVWIETTDWSPDTALRSGSYTSFMGCLIMEI